MVDVVEVSVASVALDAGASVVVVIAAWSTTPVVVVTSGGLSTTVTPGLAEEDSSGSGTRARSGCPTASVTSSGGVDALSPGNNLGPRTTVVAMATSNQTRRNKLSLDARTPPFPLVLLPGPG